MTNVQWFIVSYLVWLVGVIVTSSALSFGFIAGLLIVAVTVLWGGLVGSAIVDKDFSDRIEELLSKQDSK